nr:ABC transporter ATP-binding protein [Specibacter cremeus]
MNPDAPALSVRGLGKQFGDRVAFRDVSFEVGRGEIFGFLGPNGAGKTTTARTLGTLLAPMWGSATVAGVPLTPGNGEEIRQRIGIMPESPGLYLRLSAIENLRCFADLQEVPDAVGRIDRTLEAVHQADRAHDPCGTLSKGLRQRVALARVLLSDPQVLFLDEPAAGLDPGAARDVQALITALGRRGVTVFLTTHRLEEAERLCDRLAIPKTTGRTIGRPEEHRDRLFAKRLTITIQSPLPDPSRVFAGLPAVDGWHRDGPAGYVLDVLDPAGAAPAATRALVAAGMAIVPAVFSVQPLVEVLTPPPTAAAPPRRRTRPALHAWHPRPRAGLHRRLRGGGGTPAGDARTGAHDADPPRGVRPGQGAGHPAALGRRRLCGLRPVPGLRRDLRRSGRRGCIHPASGPARPALVHAPPGRVVDLDRPVDLHPVDRCPRRKQLAALTGLPSIAVTTLVAFNVIQASFATAVAGTMVLLLLNWLGWRFVPAVFDRERLITGTR